MKQRVQLFVVALISMTLPAAVSAFSPIGPPSTQVAQSATQEVGRNGLTVEIYYNGELFRNHALLPTPPGHYVYSYSIFRVPKGEVSNTREGDRVFAFQILPSLKGDSARVEILALLEDPDTVSEAHPMERIKKRPVASHLARAGETVRVSEMSQFGMRPLEIKIKAVGVTGKNPR